jgi:DeoR/GlpR family transcriptional regulator of sugar metabolism
LRPEFSIILATQWRFIEKIFRYRFEKHSIARKIATKYVGNNTKLLLDSGSTTDLVTSELLISRATGVHVYSNNVFAAMHLIGTTEVPLHLFQGRFSDRFAAVYSDEANNRIDQLGLNSFILAATALRFDTGIMVHNNDAENYNFKRTALMVFMRTPESKLLIAVDASKFFEPVSRHQGIVTQSEWGDIISRAADRIVIVTSPPGPDFDAAQRAFVEQEIAKFRNACIEVDESP